LLDARAISSSGPQCRPLLLQSVASWTGPILAVGCILRAVTFRIPPFHLLCRSVLLNHTLSNIRNSFRPCPLYKYLLIGSIISLDWVSSPPVHTTVQRCVSRKLSRSSLPRRLMVQPYQIQSQMLLNVKPLGTRTLHTSSTG
jgi:hypothetical protein